MSRSRSASKQRGAETAKLVAARFRVAGWPHATPVGAGRSGVDILGVPEVDVEVKARADFDPTGWLRQANRSERPGVVVQRPVGYGPARVDEWPFLMRFGDALELLQVAYDRE